MKNRKEKLMGDILIEVEKKLKKYGQEHLLNGYSKLDEVKQKKLIEQIQNIDFNLINSLYESTNKFRWINNRANTVLW